LPNREEIPWRDNIPLRASFSQRSELEQPIDQFGLALGAAANAVFTRCRTAASIARTANAVATACSPLPGANAADVISAAERRFRSL
jgi:hypothetical protein